VYKFRQYPVITYPVITYPVSPLTLRSANQRLGLLKLVKALEELLLHPFTHPCEYPPAGIDLVPEDRNQLIVVLGQNFHHPKPLSGIRHHTFAEQTGNPLGFFALGNAFLAFFYRCLELEETLILDGREVIRFSEDCYFIHFVLPIVGHNSIAYYPVYATE
jgi:hypothetical protein